MITRKILTAALGLALAVGAAAGVSATTTTTSPSAKPAAVATAPKTAIKTPVKAAKTTSLKHGRKMSLRAHRVHVSHRVLKPAKVAKASIGKRLHVVRGTKRIVSRHV